MRPWQLLAVLLTVAASSVALARFVVATDASIEYDDAVYLTRALYHAAQVSERGNLLLPRLVWSLGFESPKPPLFHGLLALAVLGFGRDRLPAVLVTGTLVPLLALAAAIFALARAAAGPRAGLFALAAYLAMPAALGLGTRLLTETTLAATVVAGTFFAFRRGRGGGLVDEVGLGVCSGLSLLAKLLGPLFLAPAAAVAMLACWRAEGARRACRFAAVAAAVSLLVAGPWYLRNGQAALAFARYSREQLSSLYTKPAWMRPLDLVRGTIGWPLAIVVLLLLLRRPAKGGERELLRRMVLCASAVAAVVIGVQPMFDPRFWLPAAALVAAWAGIELDALWNGAARPQRGLAVAAAAALVVITIHGVFVRTRPQTPWRASAVIARLASTSPPSPSRLCTLGNNPDWNVEKVRLAAELSGLRPRPAVADLLVDGEAIDFARRLDRCDVVFALRPQQIPAAANQQALNADLGAAWAQVGKQGTALASDPVAAAALGSRARPLVLLRRPARSATTPTWHQP